MNRNIYYSNLSNALMVKSKANLNLTPYISWLLRLAVEMRQIQVFHDEYKRVIGYMIWANVCIETLNAAKESEYPIKFDYEINDGNIKLIIDFISLEGLSSRVRKQTAQAIDNCEAYYKRKNKLIKLN